MLHLFPRLLPIYSREHFFSAEEEDLRVAQGDFHHARDLLIAELVEIEQDDAGAVLLRQPGDGPVDDLPLLKEDGGVDGVRGGIAVRHEVLGVDGVDVDRRPFLHPPELVDAEVLRDGEEPGGELLLRPERLDEPERAQERLLRQVLAKRRVLEEVVDEGEDRALIPREDDLERLAVPPLGLARKPGVVVEDHRAD